jgi:hypothetical protein
VLPAGSANHPNGVITLPLACSTLVDVDPAPIAQAAETLELLEPVGGGNPATTPR